LEVLELKFESRKIIKALNYVDRLIGAKIIAERFATHFSGHTSRYVLLLRSTGS